MNRYNRMRAERSARAGRRAALRAFEAEAVEEGGTRVPGPADAATYAFPERHTVITLTGFEGGLPSAFDAQVSVSEVVRVPWPDVELPQELLAEAERLLISKAQRTVTAVKLHAAVREALSVWGTGALLDPAIGFTAKAGHRPTPWSGLGERAYADAIGLRHLVLSPAVAEAARSMVRGEGN